MYMTRPSLAVEDHLHRGSSCRRAAPARPAASRSACSSSRTSCGRRRCRARHRHRARAADVHGGRERDARRVAVRGLARRAARPGRARGCRHRSRRVPSRRRRGRAGQGDGAESSSARSSRVWMRAIPRKGRARRATAPCAPRARAAGPFGTGSPNWAAASASVATGPAITSSPSKSSSHSASGRSRKTAASSRGERLLILVVVALDELGAPDQLAEAWPELRLDRRDREEAPVGRLVDPVAREPAGQRALRLAVQTVRREPVRVVCHRHDDVLAAARALALEQRGENLDDGEAASRPRGLRPARAGDAGAVSASTPAQPSVVEVVAGALVVRAEAGDRAVDDGVGNVAAPIPSRSATPGRNPSSTMSACAHKRRPEPRIALQVPDDRLLAAR